MAAASAGWAYWAARAEEYLVPATEQMLDLAGVAPGARVLDVGCGSGEQTLIAARRVGETGHVLPTDIAAPMIAATERNAAAVGLGNISTLVSAADALPAEAGPFDAAISRLVLMLVPDPVAAAAAVLRLLRPGAAFAAIVIGDRAKTGFHALALDILARHGGRANWENAPGSIRSLVDPELFADVMRRAGFVDVDVRTVPTTQRMASAADMTRMIRDGFAFFRSLIAGLTPEAAEAAWTDVEHALRRFEGPDGFVGPNALNLAVGRKPTG
jgi:ubiquinone/menaquinone biosynthesis C-methylase UbiE